MKTIINFLQGEEGVTAIEYALIAALVSVAAIVGWTALGTSNNTQTTAIAANVAVPVP